MLSIYYILSADTSAHYEFLFAWKIGRRKKKEITTTCCCCHYPPNPFDFHFPIHHRIFGNSRSKNCITKRQPGKKINESTTGRLRNGIILCYRDVQRSFILCGVIESQTRAPVVGYHRFSDTYACVFLYNFVCVCSLGLAYRFCACIIHYLPRHDER